MMTRKELESIRDRLNEELEKGEEAQTRIGDYLTEIQTALENWEAGKVLLLGSKNKGALDHLLWGQQEQRLRIGPRKIRKDHERLCDRQLRWSLEFPEPMINTSCCWECFKIAVQIGAKMQVAS